MPKTIFHTTEKSNFILNMKTSEYYGFNLKILLGFLILMPVFCLPLEFFKVYSVPGMAFAIIGVFAMVFAFIGYMKGVTPESLILPTALLGGAVGLGIISVIRAYDLSAALTGEDGRSEGLLSVVFYGCLFLLGAQLGTENNHRKLFRGMLWMGLVQCFWALLQTLPIGLPSYYQNLNSLLLFRLFLPSGLTGSPVFLAMLLVMLLFPAMLGAALEERKQERVFYGICAAVFAVFAVKTQCILGVFGTLAAFLAAAAVILCKKGSRRHVLLVTAAALAAGLLWSFFTPAINGTYSRSTGSDVSVSNGFALYDGGIIWQDSAYRLGTSGYYVEGDSPNPNGDFSIHSLKESYGYQWKVTAGKIARFPLDGTGPDCLAYSQLYQNYEVLSNPNVFDRCYNYYLYLPAVLGIPAALCIFAVFGISLKRGIPRKGESWLYTGIFGAVLLYMLMLVIGTTAVTITPVFWMLAGILAGQKKEAAK